MVDFYDLPGLAVEPGAIKKSSIAFEKHSTHAKHSSHACAIRCSLTIK